VVIVLSNTTLKTLRKGYGHSRSLCAICSIALKIKVLNMIESEDKINDPRLTLVGD